MMTYRSDQGKVYFVREGQPRRFLFSFHEVRNIYDEWENKYGSKIPTSEIENQARYLMNSNFSSKKDSYNFLIDVIIWGFSGRILGKVKTNSHSRVVKILQDACKEVCKSDPQTISLANAKNIIQNGLFGIGPTFSSAYIRMMYPDHAGMLHQKMRTELGYGVGVGEYTRFLDDFNRLQSILEDATDSSNNIPEKLRICDVEMIVYAALDRE